MVLERSGKLSGETENWTHGGQGGAVTANEVGDDGGVRRENMERREEGKYTTVQPISITCPF